MADQKILYKDCKRCKAVGGNKYATLTHFNSTFHRTQIFMRMYLFNFVLKAKVPCLDISQPRCKGLQLSGRSSKFQSKHIHVRLCRKAMPNYFSIYSFTYTLLSGLQNSNRFSLKSLTICKTSILQRGFFLSLAIGKPLFYFQKYSKSILI